MGGILSSPSSNSLIFLRRLVMNIQYSINCVSNANAKRCAPFGYSESIKAALAQCDVFLILSQPLI